MEGVLAAGREMAGEFRAEIHLVHVREFAAVPIFPAATIGYPGMGMPEIGGLAGGPAELVNPIMPNEKETNRLEVLREEMLRQGLNVTAHEREGGVADEILQVAREISADLIVMGSHGHGAVYNLLVGSVTAGVMKAGKCPILLIPPPAGNK